MFSNSVPYTASSRLCSFTQRRTSVKAFRCGRDMVLSTRCVHCASWRSASSFSRASFSRSWAKRRRFSAHCSNCSPTLAKLFCSGPTSSCSKRSMSTRRASALCTTFRALTSACFISASQSFSFLAACSLRSFRALISSPKALLRCWMLLYCERRPCLARNCSRCASAICFRCMSSRRFAVSTASCGSCSRISFCTFPISALMRFTSAWASARALSASFALLVSSSSSNFARVSSSMRAVLVRSVAWRSTSMRCLSSVTCCTSASTSANCERNAVALRCSLLSFAVRSRRSTSSSSSFCRAVVQSRSVSSYSKQRRLRSSCWYSTNSRCSSSRFLIRCAITPTTSSVFSRLACISSKSFSDSALRAS
mmetsp:Transcript_93168/g.199842  ORF Transcript_93168/g.199842 Transcript_93168/m.199842 type:complete len:367 (+) Transcript_93168:2092-3192(+)